MKLLIHRRLAVIAAAVFVLVVLNLPKAQAGQIPGSLGGKDQNIIRSWEVALAAPEKVTTFSPPPVNGPLPATIGKLVNLEVLDLSNRGVTSLPPEIGKLKSLRRLILERNSLETLPVEIGALFKLESLSLASNHISALPESIGQLASLDLLNLNGNHLKALPNGITSLDGLKHLWLRNNALTELPSDLGQMRRLRQLSISGNAISRLPKSIGGLSSLKLLDAFGNQLTEFPPELQGLPSLEILNLGNNRIAKAEFSEKILPELEILVLDAACLETAEIRKWLPIKSRVVSYRPTPPPAGPSAVKVRPRVMSVGKPKYTEEARVNLLTGKVVLRLEVLPDGKVGEIELARSLGFGLDENAIQSVLTAVFEPAKDDAGQPVTSKARIEVNFNIY